MNKEGDHLFAHSRPECFRDSEAFSHPPIVNTEAGEYEKMKPLKDSPLLLMYFKQEKIMIKWFSAAVVHSGYYR